MKALEPKFPYADNELEETEKEMKGNNEVMGTKERTSGNEEPLKGMDEEEISKDTDPTEALREFYAMLDPQDKEILKQIVMEDTGSDKTTSEDMEMDNSVGKV